MTMPCYIGLDEARTVLAGIGIDLTPRQIKRAADLDGNGRRKLPFFIDPIDGRRKIEKNTLLAIYNRREVDAENNARISPAHANKPIDPRP